MSAIKFSADFDDSKLQEGIKRSNQTVSDWVKSVEQVGNTADKSFQKAGDAMSRFATFSKTEMKDAIDLQKQSIKELEQQLARLQEVQSKASGRNLSNANLAVGGKKNELAAERATLIAMQNEQAKASAAAAVANNLEKESQHGIIGSLQKWAIGLFTVHAAMKVSKEIIESTEATAHKFEQVTTAAASATNYFFKSIASGDWSNFWSGMDRAVKGAIDYVDAMEKLKNLQNEQRIRSSALDIGIGKARAGTYSTDPKEVKENLKEVIRLQTLKLTEEAALQKQDYENKLKKVASDNNWSEIELQNTIRFYSKNREIIEKGEKYNELVDAKAAAKKNLKDSPQMAQRYLEVTKELEELSKEKDISIFGNIASKYSKVPMAVKTELADYLAKSQEAVAAIDLNNRRDKQRLVNIQKQEEQDAIAEGKRIQDEKNRQSLEQINYDTKIGRQRIDNQIAIEQGLLDTMKDGAEKERQQADLDYRKALNEIAKQKADQLKEYNELNGGIDKKTGKRTKKYKSQLPSEDQSQLDQQAVIAKQKKANDLVLIEEKEAEKIRVIVDQLHDYRLTGIEKEKEAVKDKYDKEEKLAMDAMRFDLVAQIAELRGKANEEIDRKYALQEVDYQEQIDTLNAQISIKNETELQKALFEIWKAKQLEKAEILAKGTPEEKKQAVIIKKNVEVSTNAETKKEIENTAKKMLEISQAAIDAGNSLATMFDSFGNDKLASDISNTTELLGATAQTGQGVARIMAGDIVGGIKDVIGGITKFISSLNKIHDAKFEKDIQALQVRVDALKKSYDDLGKSIARAYSSTKADLINKETENLKKQNDLIQQQKEDEMWKKKSDQGKINAYNEQIKANNEQIAENTKYAVVEAIMGSDIKSAIDDFATAYADAWSAGESAAAKSTDIVTKLIRTAIIEMLKNELAPEVTEFMTYLSGALKDGVIDPAEQLIIDGFVTKLNDEADKVLKPTGNLLKNPLGTASSTLTGSIKRDITEETAGEMAGILRKQSDDTRRMVNYSKLAVDHLVGIEANTFNTVEELKKINLKVDAMAIDISTTAKNTKPTSSKGLGII